jgi:serine/threonine protein kinase
MGAYGSVFLCEHVLDGQPLGLYAVKKVAVGKDKPYRRSVLREVEVLKGLRHDNISASFPLLFFALFPLRGGGPLSRWSLQSPTIMPGSKRRGSRGASRVVNTAPTSGSACLLIRPSCRLPCPRSSFGPYIDSLHILMQYAPLGSLEDYLAERSGTSGGTAGAGGPDVKRSGQRVDDVKAAFRARRGSQKPVERGERRGVRLMGKAEIDVIFGGIVRGLGYLVRSGCVGMLP